MKLGEVAQIVDCEHKTAPIDENGAYFAVGTSAMRGNVINYREARRISKNTFDAWTKRITPKAGDVLFAREAPVGPVVEIPAEENVAPGQRTVLIRATTDAVQRFIAYKLKEPLMQNQIEALSAGSTVPHLNVKDIRELELGYLPTLASQHAIADVLGALDDKIAANQRVVNSITDLQSAIWNRAIKDVERVPVESVALPQLGGTPARKVQENWTNEIPWSSVADMTAANGKYLLSTAEGISTECAKTRRFAPLPAGAVLLSARGTVGKVVTLVSPTSFNQSAYGFAEPENRSAALRLAIEGIVEELRSKSYGSVFSTITKGTILECTVPNVFHEEYFDLHSHLGMLEDRAISAVKENQVLAATRDELLPLLMNGKITVAEAKEAAGDVGVVKQNQQEEGDGSV